MKLWLKRTWTFIKACCYLALFLFSLTIIVNFGKGIVQPVWESALKVQEQVQGLNFANAPEISSEPQALIFEKVDVPRDALKRADIEPDSGIALHFFDGETYTLHAFKENESGRWVLMIKSPDAAENRYEAPPRRAGYNVSWPDVSFPGQIEKFKIGMYFDYSYFSYFVISPKYYFRSAVLIDGKKQTAIIHDNNADGRISPGDRWELTTLWSLPERSSDGEILSKVPSESDKRSEISIYLADGKIMAVRKQMGPEDLEGIRDKMSEWFVPFMTPAGIAARRQILEKVAEGEDAREFVSRTNLLANLSDSEADQISRDIAAEMFSGTRPDSDTTVTAADWRRDNEQQYFELYPLPQIHQLIRKGDYKAAKSLLLRNPIIPPSRGGHDGLPGAVRLAYTELAVASGDHSLLDRFNEYPLESYPPLWRWRIMRTLEDGQGKP